MTVPVKVIFIFFWKKTHFLLLRISSMGFFSFPFFSTVITTGDMEVFFGTVPSFSLFFWEKHCISAFTASWKCSGTGVEICWIGYFSCIQKIMNFLFEYTESFHDFCYVVSVPLHLLIGDPSQSLRFDCSEHRSVTPRTKIFWVTVWNFRSLKSSPEFDFYLCRLSKLLYYSLQIPLQSC